MTTIVVTILIAISATVRRKDGLDAFCFRWNLAHRDLKIGNRYFANTRLKRKNETHMTLIA